jgi:hypothetical protein
MVGVTGSIPVAPTIEIKDQTEFSFQPECRQPAGSWNVVCAG